MKSLYIKLLAISLLGASVQLLEAMYNSNHVKMFAIDNIITNHNLNKVIPPEPTIEDFCFERDKQELSKLCEQNSFIMAPFRVTKNHALDFDSFNKLHKKVLFDKTDNKIIGFISYHSTSYNLPWSVNSWYIPCLIVSLSHWDKGYGSKLIDYVINTTNASEITLACWKENKAGIRFYNKKGFNHEGDFSDEMFRMVWRR